MNAAATSAASRLRFITSTLPSNPTELRQALCPPVDDGQLWPERGSLRVGGSKRLRTSNPSFTRRTFEEARSFSVELGALTRLTHNRVASAGRLRPLVFITNSGRR